MLLQKFLQRSNPSGVLSLQGCIACTPLGLSAVYRCGVSVPVRTCVEQRSTVSWPSKDAMVCRFCDVCCTSTALLQAAVVVLICSCAGYCLMQYVHSCLLLNGFAHRQNIARPDRAQRRAATYRCKACRFVLHTNTHHVCTWATQPVWHTPHQPAHQ